jgi:DnaJ-domain-containing protein 1
MSELYEAFNNIIEEFDIEEHQKKEDEHNKQVEQHENNKHKHSENKLEEILSKPKKKRKE